MKGNYSQKDYWNERFKKEQGHFDWYAGWKELRRYITPLIDQSSCILVVGCGNSKMSEEMYFDKYEKIVNIDISDVVVDKMNSLNKCKNMKCKFFYLDTVMDATRMEFEANTFDLTIDKGTLDAISCAKEDNESYRLVGEMHRVTKVNGHYCFITHSPAESRISLFEDHLDSQAYKLDCLEIELSFVSDLINALKANKDKSLTMKEALKDKAFLMKTLLEVISMRNNKNDKLDFKSIISDLHSMNLIKSGDTSNGDKPQKEGTDIEDSSSSKKLPVEDSKKDEKTHSTTNKETQIETNSANDESNSEGNEKKQSLRRNQCYLYVVKKLK